MNLNFSSILALLEDPNAEVFEAIELAILEQGFDLENDIASAIENNTDVLVHNRLLQIQKKIRYNKVGSEILDWFHHDDPSVVSMLMLTEQLLNLDVQNESLLLSFLDQLKRNIWIELNYYLTPLEQVNVINSIIYNYYGFGTEDLGTTVFDSKSFYLSTIYHEKLGNRFSIAALYMHVCKEFDIPIQPIYLDNQELYLAYFTAINFEEQDFNIAFYINPSNGAICSQMEVISMLKSQDIVIDPVQFKPLSIKQFFALYLKQLQFSYLVEQDFITANFLKGLAQSVKKYLVREDDMDIFE